MDAWKEDLPTKTDPLERDAEDLESDQDQEQYQSEQAEDQEAVPQEQLARPGPLDQSEQRVALITGGSSGLGMAAAIELARRGWSLFVQHASAPAVAEDAQRAILQAAQQVGQEIRLAFSAADLTSSEGREQLVENALETFERIDLLINAATCPAVLGEDLLEMPEGNYRSVLDAALTATFFLTQRVASEMVRMVEAGQIENPRIVTINTINAYTSSVDSAALCIAQAGLGMMTQLFADRLGEHGINVYEIRAGIIAAGTADQSHARYDALIAQGLTPVRRWGRPGDVARAIAAIAEGHLGFSTGEVINVDGGFHLRRL